MMEIIPESENKSYLDIKHGDGFAKKLEEYGTLEIREDDHVLTYKHKRFRVSWKRKSDGNVITHMVSESSADKIHKMIDKKVGHMDFRINGVRETLSWIEWAGTSELQPEKRFEPIELPPEKQAENIKRMNLIKMQAIQKANPGAWGKAQESDNSFKSMGNILKTQKE